MISSWLNLKILDEIEVELDCDGTMSLETLRIYFGSFVNALTYKNPTTGRDRVVAASNGRFLSPKGGWSNRVYTVTSGQVNTPTSTSNVSNPPLVVNKEENTQLPQGIQWG